MSEQGNRSGGVGYILKRVAQVTVGLIGLCMGFVLFVVGLLLTLTIIGAILGIPLMIGSAAYIAGSLALIAGQKFMLKARIKTMEAKIKRGKDDEAMEREIERRLAEREG